MKKFAGGENKHRRFSGGKPLRDVRREAGGWESRFGEREQGADCGKEAEPWGEGAGWTYARSKSGGGEHQGGSCGGVGGHHPQPLLCAQTPTQMLYSASTFTPHNRPGRKAL